MLSSTEFQVASEIPGRKKAKQTRRWLEVFSKLARNANRFVDACDYDIEGSIIGYNILKYACSEKDKAAKRMKYSTLTDEELLKAYRNPMQHLDFDLIEAGLARHEIDWLYGINLSRTLTTAVKNCSGKYTTLSIGRVQGPTLKFLATREKAIRNFVSVRYWQLSARVLIDGHILDAEYNKARIDSESEALSIKNACHGKNGTIQKTEERLTRQNPPVPFDLGTLQTEAYRLFKYTPKLTSEIAQRLYINALISYPRTSSQKLPPAIDYRAVLESLGNVADYRRLIADLLMKRELAPHEGKRQDFAHPAIYPTGECPRRGFGTQDRKLWDLIVRRFMAVFAEPALRQSTRVTLDINGYGFVMTAEQTIKEGWISHYKPYVTSKHSTLPKMKETQTVTVKRIGMKAKLTEAPPRYDPRSLLRKMESEDIGTKATRAEIIQTLYGRKYVKGEEMVLTDLGLEVVNVLEENCPSIISSELTREIEAQMNSIRAKGEKRDKMIAETIDKVKEIVRELKNKEDEVGERLTQAVRRITAEEKTIGNCPACEGGKLLIVYSRSTGKRFVGCTNYFKGMCKASFPLPQKGIMNASGKSCRRCGWPTLKLRSKWKHVRTLCFNPECQRTNAKETTGAPKKREGFH